ncbi:hypothetical protein GWI33_022198 [Rhynchophorus ferrugineus]|uniref:Chemosensory protein n=1 Tax=Rhynchophorus ferrugineus TaxID=354439 RepID=A0A834J0N4_RHYFE|nr:hypothetical protein GWI33_022198 [Rhynchophorus ferrugineus]
MILIVSVFVGLTLDYVAAKPAVQYYSTKYDHVDVEAILNNRRLVNYYSACLLSKGPCPTEGVELKRILPESLQSNCGRCTEKQKAVAFRAIKRLKKEYPKIWNELSHQWDPDDVFVKKFEQISGQVTPAKPVTESVVIVNRFASNDEPTDNTIDGALPPLKDPKADPSTTQKPKPHSEVTRSPPSSSSSSKSPSVISSSLRPSTPKPPASTSKKSPANTPPASIPGLIPLNTFFTNSPIPIGPIPKINLGSNIDATVKAIKRVEKLVAGIAMEKIGIVRNMFLRPWRRLRKQT